MNASSQKSRRKAITFEPTIPKKLREARFLLSHMMQSARSTQSDREHFEFYLSAFLSAARSVTGFFENKKQQKHITAWWRQWKARRPADLQLLNQMTKHRDNEVHEEGADVSHQMEDVPLSKIETPSGLHAAYAPSFGELWGEAQISLKVYYFTLGGKTVPVTETCQRYVTLLERAVAEFSKV
jgi:hypothetical protein